MTEFQKQAAEALVFTDANWPCEDSYKRAVERLARALTSAYNSGLSKAAEIAQGYGKKFGDENKDKWTITHTAAGLNIAQAIRAERVQ